MPLLLDAVGEGLGAEPAAEGLLARVAAQVGDQVALLGEGTGAQVALVRPLARVDALVHLHSALERCFEAALRAAQQSVIQLHCVATTRGAGRGGEACWHAA